METRRLTRWTVAAVLTGLALALAACGGASSDKAGGADKSKPRVLTMVSQSGTTAQLAAFAEELIRLSNGTLKVEFKEGWRPGEAGYEAGTLDDVKSGKIEMAWVGARAFDTVGVTNFQALIAPLLIDSYDLEARVFEEGIPKRMLEGIDQLDLVGIGVLPGPMRKLLGVSQPFVRPRDFAGQVVGLQDSAVAQKTVKALGAAPRPVPAQTSLDGLDAYEQQLGSIAGNRYDSTAKYVTANVNLWPRPLVIVMGQEAFESLTDEQQSALRDAAVAAVAGALAVSRAEDDEAAAILCRRGMIFAVASETDLAELRSALEPVYAELTADPETKSHIDAIANLKAEIAASAEAPACTPTESPATASPVKAERTPIDGEYEFTTTAEELLAAGSPDALAENFGKFRWILGSGRFEMTQKNGASDRWTKGTYVVRKNIVEFTVEAFGGTAPNNASEKTGEVYTYTWSLYRDQLKLGPVEGAISPETFRAKPWRRVGDVPVAAAKATPIDGVYRTSFTRAALERSPKLMDAEEINDENWGDFTLMLSKGRVTFEQTNDVASYSTSGTFAVDGDSIVMEFTDGGNADEIFAFRWSLYRDTLTFRRDAALGIVPTPYLVNTWHRVG